MSRKEGHMVGRKNEIVITVDPVREEAKSRQEEVRAAAKNDGTDLRAAERSSKSS